MSTPIKDGGAAFHAITCKNGDNYNHPTLQYHRGMSLRDWFAGQALAGFLASLTEREAALFGDPFHVAETSYAYADAMLDQREVKP